MQNKDIEIFLELVSSRNITKASEHLFMAQSVISTRLKKLEEELGYELFIRAKGQREIELTRQGKDFVSIAMRMKNLYDEAEVIREETQHVLRIACPESICIEFLEPLLMRIARRYPDIKLYAQMIDSSAVYEQMESNLIDFGFASYESSHHDIVHQAVYEQKFCLVCGKETGAVAPADLNPEKEVRLTGGNFSSVELWRDRWFQGLDRSRIEVNSPHILVKFIRDLGCWAILPEGTAQMLSELYDVRICGLADTPEARTIYLLKHGTEKNSSEAGAIFEKELEEFIR